MNTIKLDIDGVLRDIITPMVELYNAKFSNILTRPLTTDDVTSYNLNVSFPLVKEKLHINPFDFFFRDHDLDILKMADACPGADDAVNELRSMGYKIIITSYQPTDSAKKLTIDWLRNHDIHYDYIVFTNSESKKDIVCDFIIDDRPKYLIDSDDKYKVCIRQPYNCSPFDLRPEWICCRDLPEFVKKLKTSKDRL